MSRPTLSLPNLLAHLSMLLWAWLVAAAFFAAAEINPAVDALPLSGVRLLLSALLFLPLLLAGGGLPRGRALAGHALLGLLLTLYFASLFEALKYTSALNAALLFLSVPLLSLAFEAGLLRRGDARARLLPTLLAAAGAFWLVLQRPAGDGHLSAYPLLIFVGGCLAMALYAPLSHWLGDHWGCARQPARATCFNLLFGALFLGLFSLPGGSWRTLGLLNSADLAWLAFLALFGTLATFWLLHHAARHIAPASLLAYSYLSTLCALLIQAGLNQQLPTAGSWVGAAAILLGLLWLARRGTPRMIAGKV